MRDYKHIKDEFEIAKGERSNWDTMYQVLGEYISQIKQDFQGQPANGEFLTDEIFDSTGTFAAHNSASALLGMLWPGTAAQSIEITKPDDMDDSTELTDFYEMVTDKLTRAMDDPKANLILALDEYMLDQMIFSTSGVGVELGEASKLLYRPYGVKEMYLDEGKDGRVNKVWLFYEWRASRVVAEYGIDNVSEKVRKQVEDGNGKGTVKILVAIRPREEKIAEKGKFAMDYESVHLEFNDCHPLREEGFHELPIKVSRFTKLNYEKQGRGAGMFALPDIKEANALREAIIIATEKGLNMPQGVLSDGILGSGYIDTSANAVNVFNASSRVGNTPPIFDIGSPPDVAVAEKRLEALQQSISQHFHIDRLLDFNNDTVMTFGEAQIRDQLRTSSLSGLFGRQIAELFTPLIERSIGILWRDGEFGVAPDSIEEQEVLDRGEEPEHFPDVILERLKQGKDVYNIVYKTKAANASKAEEYLAILDILSFAMQSMNVDPSVANRVDLHEGIKVMANIRGVPTGIIRQDDAVKTIEDKQKQQRDQAIALDAANSVANTTKTAAEADEIMGTTGTAGAV
jgi:hypothetical protein